MRRVILIPALAASFTLGLTSPVEPPLPAGAQELARSSSRIAEYSPRHLVPSDSQAEIGRRWFAASCEECHALDEIASDDFKAKWSGRTAFDLFDLIGRTMPENEPGTLPRRAYVDIVAYLMKQNGVTATVPLADNDSVLSATVLRFASSSQTRR